MKKILGFVWLLCGLVFVNNLKAQDDSPVKWDFEISEKPNVMGMYEITFTANIEEKWHMYSQNLPSPDDGPLPTVFTFDYQDAFDIVGHVAEQTKPHAVFDDVFEVNVNYFDGKAVFKQLVSLNDKENGATIKGTVSYMVCNDNTCLPPVDVPFALTIKP
mgnify:CR=1 FL=1